MYKQIAESSSTRSITETQAERKIAQMDRVGPKLKLSRTRGEEKLGEESRGRADTCWGPGVERCRKLFAI